MIIEKLYQTGKLPKKTPVHRIKQVEQHLSDLLRGQMRRGLRWIAICSVAVEAGCRIAHKRKAQRIKLLKLINVCRKARKAKPIIPKEGWEEANLVYGYGAVYSQKVDPLAISWMVALIQASGLNQSSEFKRLF